MGEKKGEGLEKAEIIVFYIFSELIIKILFLY